LVHYQGGLILKIVREDGDKVIGFLFRMIKKDRAKGIFPETFIFDVFSLYGDGKNERPRSDSASEVIKNLMVSNNDRVSNEDMTMFQYVAPQDDDCDNIFGSLRISVQATEEIQVWDAVEKLIKEFAAFFLDGFIIHFTRSSLVGI
jgi:hypothetical protein